MDENNEKKEEEVEPLIPTFEDSWTWSKRDRSQEVWLSGFDNRTVHFHPNWSKGTAGVRGNRILNNGRFYWELKVSQRVFGTRFVDFCFFFLFNIQMIEAKYIFLIKFYLASLLRTG